MIFDMSSIILCCLIEIHATSIVDVEIRNTLNTLSTRPSLLCLTYKQVVQQIQHLK